MNSSHHQFKQPIKSPLCLLWLVIGQILLLVTDLAIAVPPKPTITSNPAPSGIPPAVVVCQDPTQTQTFNTNWESPEPTEAAPCPPWAKDGDATFTWTYSTLVGNPASGTAGSASLNMQRDQSGTTSITVQAEQKWKDQGTGTATVTSDPSDPVTFTVVNVKTETVVMVPSDRTRKKIGVGEKVKLTIEPSFIGSETWSVTGGGSVNPTSGMTTTFTAGANAATSTVKATLNGGSECKVVFTVVPPSGLFLRQKPGTGVLHHYNTLSIGFKGLPYLKPTEVSFVNIQVREKRVRGEGTGYLAFMTGIPHKPALNWEDVVSGDNDASGSRVRVTDTVEFIVDTRSPPFTEGMFTFPIPLEYKLVTGSAPMSGGIVNQILSTHPSEEINALKGGTSVSKKASDPTSHY